MVDPVSADVEAVGHLIIDGPGEWIGSGAQLHEMAALIAARVRAEALREAAEKIAPNQVRPSNVIVVGARMTENVLGLVRTVEDALVAAVRAEAVAEHRAEQRHWIEVGQQLEAEKRVTEAERDEYRRNWQEAEKRTAQAVAEAVAGERQRIATAAVELATLTDQAVVRGGYREGGGERVETLWQQLGVVLPDASVPVATPPRPEIVVLCGSTRFGPAFEEATKRLGLEGRIVLSVATYGHMGGLTPEQMTNRHPVKDGLDELHERKIDLADRVLVLNVGGYIGESTRSEIEYATAHRKPITYLEPTCICPWTDPSAWTYYGGATEPGSEREFDPECPQHGQSAGPVATPELEAVSQAVPIRIGPKEMARLRACLTRPDRDDLTPWEVVECAADQMAAVGPVATPTEPRGQADRMGGFIYDPDDEGPECGWLKEPDDTRYGCQLPGGHSGKCEPASPVPAEQPDGPAPTGQEASE